MPWSACPGARIPAESRRGGHRPAGVTAEPPGVGKASRGSRAGVFYESWNELLRVPAAAGLAYLILIAAVRPAVTQKQGRLGFHQAPYASEADRGPSGGDCRRTSETSAAAPCATVT
ncbi:hypothetical protein GCM10010253_22770 [Streptomyces badius]|uniref:Uncharacterized protein n=1 Tax=Streptomyces badius TaxID=1941 RepID=A0ABQ2T325_STRBA|nr:hypothetical protein GCM10010253_22770 [Streptomyces badius]